MSEIQTPELGTEQENVTPQENVEVEQPQAPVEEPAIEPTEPQEPEKPAEDPYKKKFVESQREAILLNERLNQEKARNESLTKQDTPTDEAMRKLYPEWDQLEPFTKNVLIRQEASNMRTARIEAEQQDIKTRQQLDDKLDDFLENPPQDFKKLEGKASDFRRFAKQKKNIGLSLETLAKAFLFDVEDETPANPNPESMPTEALPTGSGGPREPLKPKKISGEEAANLRKTNYNEWRRLVLEGVIEEEL